MRVLYVEDSPADADLARVELGRFDPTSTIDIAPALAEARRRLTEGGPFDLALLDLRLPDGSGMDLLQEIRQRGIPVAVVILTSVGDEEIAVAALKAGADDYVAKREGYIARLPTTLEQALGRFRAEAARRSGTLRVLYAEHHAADVELTLRHLKAHAPHIRLELVDSGEEVLRRIPAAAGEPRAYDALLLDYRLPGASAIDILKVIRQERGLDMAVVLVTGQGDEEIAAQALRLGATDYLVKNPNYLWALPAALENAHHRVLVASKRVALRERDERFRELSEHVHEVFWVTDPQKTRLLYISPAFEEIWGRTCASVYESPMSFAEAIHVDDRERVLARIADQERGTYDEVYRIVRPDGSVRWIHDRAYPVRGPDGQVVRVVGSAQDITDLKRTEQALRESEGRYRSLFERSPDGILVADSAGTYVDVNPSALRMLGYSRDEFIGLKSEDILTVAEHSHVAPTLTEIHEGLEHRREWLFRRKDGSEFPGDVTAALMPDGRILALVRDASERRSMEEQLRQSQKMEAVGRLAGGIAHDFNNILGVITGYGEILRNRTPEDHPDWRRLDAIVRAAERAAGLTHQLLAFSRRQVLQPRVIEPSAVVRDLRRLLDPLIGEDIEVVLKAEATGRVKVDPGQLEQVVMNLFVNARDAMPMGGTLTIETADADLGEEYLQSRVPPIQPGRYVTIAVTDTGVGMDEATQARVFEPFFTTKVEGRGTGLGLATVYGIVKQSGGYVWLYSEVGKGTVFRVYLTRVEDAVAQEQKRPPARHRSATETLLVVEDEPAARELVAEILRSEGYSVVLAGNGQEAVEIASRSGVPIHLLLTDVVLPKLGGPAAAERIQAVHPRIKVLYMSGYTDERLTHHGVLQPGVFLIQKPFTPADLIRRVGEVLEE